ncbi:MAG: DegT/DnrJ/EryC1/StrS aminotransferase family protein [Bdellovibrionales bacterium]|nr:DegT/DnrJ/EryC1/StrS aminotransferase family protein [Bdellovibrionales bacterium]
MTVPFVDLKIQYQALKAEIDRGIQKVLDHGMYINGPEVSQAEEVLQKFSGAKAAIVCSNGTVAIQLALMALDLKPGDEVILPAFSFFATGEIPALMNLTPVFVDIQKDTYNLDPAKIKAAITSKTKVIMPVSLYGQTADMDEINEIAKNAGIAVVEDAAQSFGASYKGHKVGTLADITTTSFFPAKPLGVYGDGGALFTNDEKLGEKIRQLKNHGQAQRYYHTLIGTNARMDSLQCAILLAKLERYSWEIEQRQKVADRYDAAFKSLKRVKTPVVKEHNQSVWAQYTLEVQEDREGVRNQLQEMGIPTAVHYPVIMPDQPALKDIGRVMDVSQARFASEHVFSLPMYADMPVEVQNKVIEAVNKVLG